MFAEKPACHITQHKVDRYTQQVYVPAGYQVPVTTRASVQWVPDQTFIEHMPERYSPVDQKEEQEPYTGASTYAAAVSFKGYKIKIPFKRNGLPCCEDANTFR